MSELAPAVVSPVGESVVVAPGRPTRPLPWLHLLNISLYWLGLNVIWSGLGYLTFQARFSARYGDALAPSYVGLIDTIPLFLAVLIQPTVATISDYTITRWGRRKPYILIGSLLDIVFLYGVAASNEFIAILVFMVLLQCSSNFAQGPFQGYVPDLVPEKQVGTASGLMGLMIVLGQVVGVGIASLGIAQMHVPSDLVGTPAGGQLATNAFFWPTIGLGVIEIVTMIPIVLFVSEGRHAPSRNGRSWRNIALSAWGTDILRERSYVWLLVSRLFFLMAPAVLLFLGVFYLNRVYGIAIPDTGTPVLVITALIGATTAVTTIPAARLSDRIGRKRVIYLAAAIGFAGMLCVMFAPTFEVMAVAVIPVGVSAGAFLAVDWALMTDIIPKATSGRYMGISNVATALSGPIARLSAGFLLTALVIVGLPPELRGLDPIPAEQSSLFETGPRVVLVLSLVSFVIAALALTRVDERRRED